MEGKYDWWLVIAISITIRLGFAVYTRTSFVPDEYFQFSELACVWVFEKGIL
jgi:hypothetical protein